MFPACPGHEAQSGTMHRLSNSEDDRVALCRHCGLEIGQFWLDAEDDRSGRWSRWQPTTHVIQEEKSWSEIVSLST